MRHTPLTVGALVHHALLTARLPTTTAIVNISLGQNFQSVSILKIHGNYTQAEAKRLAKALGLADATISDSGDASRRYGVLTGRTETGIDVTIHCEPTTGGTQ